MNRLHRLIIRHEGFEQKPYNDVLTGDITIGVGRNLSSIGLSHDEVMYLLDSDIGRCDRELQYHFKWYLELGRVRQDAMINLCFNLGMTKLKSFKRALASMGDHDFEAAADHFLDSKWADQVGQRAEDVAYMIRSGKYP